MALKLIRRDGTWRIEGRLLGQRVRQSTRLPDTAAYKPMADKLRSNLEHQILEGGVARATGGRAGLQSAATWKDAADGYKAWLKVEGRLNREIEMRLARFEQTWGKVPLNQITSGAIQAWATAEMSGRKPGTVKRYLNTFRASLNWARDNIEGFAGVKVPMPRVNDERDLHFDEDQAVEFLEWVRVDEPGLFPHFLTLIDTGLRLGELMRVRGPHFTADTLRVRRRLAKTGKTLTRDIPLTPDMLVLAAKLRGKPAIERVFDVDGRTGKPWTDARASVELCAVLRRGCEAMGLPHTGDEAMRVHDLRHTYAYLVAKAGADLADLQGLLGHADIRQTMRYRGFVQSRARTAVGRARRVLDVNGQGCGQGAA